MRTKSTFHIQKARAQMFKSIYNIAQSMASARQPKSTIDEIMNINRSDRTKPDPSINSKPTTGSVTSLAYLSLLTRNTSEVLKAYDGFDNYEERLHAALP
jgi:hypothetical protein